MDNNSAILKLWLIVGIGPKVVNSICKEFKKVAEVFELPIKEISERLKINTSLATLIKNSDNELLDAELNLLDKFKVKIFTILDEIYPKYLKEIHNPPSLLYYKGDLNYDETKTIAVVGSRAASNYGILACNNIIEELAALDKNFAIVSGLAIGIDTIAHKKALEKGLKTIAVLGNGLSTVYPATNEKLLYDILSADGLVLSEFPMASKPTKFNFPNRNRIISGLSQAVIIMEAASKSGALITAEHAFEQNRDVYAVPANIDSINNQGSMDLIKKNKANLITSGLDVYKQLADRFNWQNKSLEIGNPAKDNKIKSFKPSNANQAIIAKSLGGKSLTIDALLIETKLSNGVLLAELTKLELANAIEKNQRQEYQLKDIFKN